MGNSGSKMDGCFVCAHLHVCVDMIFVLLRPREFEFIYILEKELITANE